MGWDQVQLWADGLGNVLSVQPNFVYASAATPSDAGFASQWALNNTGQSGGASDADIDAVEAWDITTGSSNVVIAVIDSSVDYDHVDLAGNIWTNAGEIPGNGIDDDGNGYVDDHFGYDFYNNDSDPTGEPGDSHGTHVAGTIGAVGNNGVGVTGVAWGVKVMALSAGYLEMVDGELKPVVNTASAIEALEYATMMKRDYGVNVVATNNSWGGEGTIDFALRSAIELTATEDILFIAAAGNGGEDNEGDNNDALPIWPANHDASNVISVANVDHNDMLAASSNYGATTVDIAAPGESIYSTTPGNSYDYLSGTSMAAPHVAGVAALLASFDPSASAAEIKGAILAGADPVAGLSGKVLTGGRLNALGALQSLAIPGPQVINITPDEYADVTNHIQVFLNEAIDPASIIPANFQLKSAGPDQFLGTTDDVTISIPSYDLSLPTPETIRINSYLTVGQYELTLVGTGPTPIRDLDGNPLEGGQSIVHAFQIVPGGVPPGAVTLSGAALTIGLNADGSIDPSAAGVSLSAAPFLYGSQHGAFYLSVDGNHYENNSPYLDDGRAISMDVFDVSAGGNNFARATGLIDGVAVQRHISFLNYDSYATFSVTLTNTTGLPIDSLAWMESMNPGQDWPSANYQLTNNDVRFGGKYIEAVGDVGDHTISMGSGDDRAVASTMFARYGSYSFPDGPNTPFEIIHAPEDPQGEWRDRSISLAFDLGTLAAGESTTFEYYLIADTTAQGARDIYTGLVPLPQHFEPNDSTWEAEFIDLNPSPNAADSQTIEAYVGDGVKGVRDVDLYRINVDAGDYLEAEVRSQVWGGDLDSALRLFDADGVAIALNSSYYGLDARIEHTFVTGGAYYIGVSGDPNTSYDPKYGGGLVDGSIGEYFLDLTLAESPLGEVRGSVWDDLDGDGTRDPGEPGLAGVTVYLDDNANGVLDMDVWAPTTAILPGQDTIPGAISNPTVFELTIGGSDQPIYDLNVWLDIDHSNAPDLDIHLISPSGTRVELLTDIGTNGSAIGTTVSGIRTTLDDEADTSIVIAPAPYTGTYRPEGLLSDFDGEDASGQWRLEIYDDTSGHTGTLERWGFEITTLAEQATVTMSDDPSTTWVNENGMFVFENVPPQSHLVRQVVPDGFNQTSPVIESGALNILLVSDTNELTGVDSFLASDGHVVTSVTNDFATGSSTVSDLAALQAYDFVIWGASGTGSGSLHNAVVYSTLESYIQGGGHLLVTGGDTLASPTNNAMASLVRSTTTADTYPIDSFVNASADHFVLNGPYGDYRGDTIDPPYTDWDGATADTSRGAISLATYGIYDAIVYTDLPDDGGSVGYWTGGDFGATPTDGKTDWKTTGDSLNMLRNWAAGLNGNTPSNQSEAPIIAYYSGYSSIGSQQALRELGFNVEPFFPHVYETSLWEAALADADILMFPPNTYGSDWWGSFSLVPDTLAVIRNFVDGGGSFLTFGDSNVDIENGSYATELINGFFGYSLTVTDVNYGQYAQSRGSFFQTPASIGTEFESDTHRLPQNYDTTGLNLSSLPVDTASLYDQGEVSAVTNMTYGDGLVGYLGWDWLNNLPLPQYLPVGFENHPDVWDLVLESFVWELVGGRPSAGAQEVLVEPGALVSNVDFGNLSIYNGSITGTKWNDYDRNGVRDDNEPGVAGWVMYLDLNTNGLLDPDEPTATTDADGQYIFTSLPAGTYTVAEVHQAGWEPTYPNWGWAYSVEPDNFTSGQDISTATPITLTALLGGFSSPVYADEPGSGVASTGGLVFASSGDSTWVGSSRVLRADIRTPANNNDTAAMVSLDFISDDPYERGPELIAYDANGLIIDQVSVPQVDGYGTVTTLTVNAPIGQGIAYIQAYWDRSGEVEAGVFDNLRYVLNTGTNRGTHEVSVADGQSVTGIDFGNHQPGGTVIGMKWRDDNLDGLRNPDEDSIPWSVVYLDADNDGVRDPDEAWTTTQIDDFATPDLDERGMYSFTNVPPGSYTVRQEVQSGRTAVFPVAGGYPITVSPGQRFSGLNFGNTYENQPPRISFFTPTPYSWEPPVRVGETLTLTVDGVTDDRGVASISVYRDANENGVGEPSELLGTDYDGSNGWVWSGAVTWSAGTHRYLAQAVDNGLPSPVLYSEWATLNDQLVAPVLIPGDTDNDGDIDDSDLGTSFANYTGPVGNVGKLAAQGDTDGDGDVDDSDLGTMFAGYTGPQAPSESASPGTLSYMLYEKQHEEPALDGHFSLFELNETEREADFSSYNGLSERVLGLV